MKLGDHPINIGDIYRVYDYCGIPYAYGAVYKDTCPIDADLWCWYIEMGDGDDFHWHRKREGQECTEESLLGVEIFGRHIELVRRNPLPSPYEELAYHLIAKLEEA